MKGQQRFAAVPNVSSLTLLYAAIGLMVFALTIQRSYYPHDHWTFWIFRASFWHLIHQQNLYARYGSHDLFKYSPTAALLFAPIALPSFAFGLLIWNAVNAGALVLAIKRVSRESDFTLALLLVVPELFVTMQASQCNALIAALIVLAFLAFEKRHQMRALLAIAVGFVIKIFPIAALTLAVFHPRRARAALVFATYALVLLLLPLLVTPASMLVDQYRWWHQIEASDALMRGASVMSMLHQMLHVDWPNWPVQAAGVIVLLLPFLHADRWADRSFRRSYLASLLVFVVIFNHQAERPSYVIAATGVAIWYAYSPRDLYRLALVLFSLTGLRVWGYLPVWLLMQFELHAASLRATLHASRASASPVCLPVAVIETRSLADAARSE